MLLLRFGLRLSFLNQFTNACFEFIDFLTHFVDSTYNVVVHLAESCLHLREHLLHQLGEILCVVNI